MFLPVIVEVRVKKFIPIVEVIATSSMEVPFWINYPLSIIKKGQKDGGKLLSSEPTEVLKKNTVFFSMIFETESKAIGFAKSLKER